MDSNGAPFLVQAIQLGDCFDVLAGRGGGRGWTGTWDCTDFASQQDVRQGYLGVSGGLGVCVCSSPLSGGRFTAVLLSRLACIYIEPER
jgi:hypothetical protein